MMSALERCIYCIVKQTRKFPEHSIPPPSSLGTYYIILIEHQSYQNIRFCVTHLQIGLYISDSLFSDPLRITLDYSITLL